MASFNIEQPSKYVLSLDSLDLSLLPTYQSKLQSTTSLWSTSNLNGKTNDYFQFEIKPKAEGAENATEMDESVDGLKEAMCYICNLKVPIAYLNDHENSLKHQAYVKIADVVLDRARQHMLKRENRCNARKIDSMHFCGPCVTVVQATDIEKHEKSKLHKRSLSLDRLLFELVSLYTDDENIEPKVSRKTIVDENLVVTDSTTDDNGNDVASEVDRNLENTVLISDVKACLNKHETEKRKDTTSKVDDNDNQLKITPLLDKVTIETLDGHEINISEDNFHGFMRIGKHHVQCKVCKLIVKNEEEHKTSKEHVNKILKPFKDKHCIRNLDNSWNHCVICNEVIENSDVHALCNESHEKLLQKALVVYKAPPNKFNILIENNTTPQINSTLNGTEYFCSTCNMGMHVNNTASHMKGNKHAMNSKSSFHYVMKPIEGANDLICRVCDVHVVDNAIDVEQHVKTTEHSRNLREFLTNNYLRQQKDEFYCKPCNVKFARMNEFYHIEKLSHEANLETYKHSLEVSNRALANVETKSDETKSVEKLNYYYCYVCNVKIPNNPSNIQSHNDGNRHRKNVSNVIAEIECAIERVAVSHVSYQMELTQNEKELRCIACNAIVPNREGNIDEHIKGSKHKNNEKKLMVENHIEMKDDGHFCKMCNVLIVSEQEFIHINLPTHVKMLKSLSQKPENTTANIQSKVNTPKVEPNAVKNGSETSEMSNADDVLSKNASVNIYSVLKHHFVETDDANIVNCRVCDITIPHTVLDALNHANDKQHMEGYRGLMSRNLIFETDVSTFFCGICNCLVPGKGEFHHVFGLRHAGNFAKVLADDHCDICNVNAAMEDHITTTNHVLKLKQTQTILNHCEVCNALITKNDVDFTQHSVNCELMLKHRLVVKDKICFCIICDLYFARNLIEEHTQSNHHLLLFNMIT